MINNYVLLIEKRKDGTAIGYCLTVKYLTERINRYCKQNNVIEYTVKTDFNKIKDIYKTLREYEEKGIIKRWFAM